MSKTDFWNSQYLAEQYADNIALIEVVADNTEKVSYAQLHQRVLFTKEAIKNSLISPSEKQLVMLLATNSINSVVHYLACLQLGHTVWWVDKTWPEQRVKQLQQLYAVNLFINDGEIKRLNSKSNYLHEELSLLITTSGSTGSPTLVRLSHQNLSSNCHAIRQALSLNNDDMVVTTLPLQYSFGLSVLNTHLASGAPILLTEATMMSRDFWNLFKRFPIQCLYGVPHSFDMLLKLSLARLPLKTLRLMAVAGGKLAPEKVTIMNDYCLENNSQFYVMYGQTEATARISVLDASKAKTKPYSIGKAIAGELWLEDEQGLKITDCNERGELCYQGENVMIGLAKQLSDLALDYQTSTLQTGDLAIVDQDGDFKIVGRLKRIIKVVGHRVNLDEIEQYFAKQGLQVACTGQDDKIECYLQGANQQSKQLQSCQSMLCEYLSIHSSYTQWSVVADFPRLSSGKLNYTLLDEQRLAGAL